MTRRAAAAAAERAYQASEPVVVWVARASAPGWGGVQRSFSVEDASRAARPWRASAADPHAALALKRAARAGLLRETNPRLLPKRYVATSVGLWVCGVERPSRLLRLRVALYARVTRR